MSTRTKTVDTRLISLENNPCVKEHNLSLKCLDDNKYDYDACLWYFENYKNCKKFWGGVISERRRQGITPDLPSVEEREKIKQEHLTNLNTQKKR